MTVFCQHRVRWHILGVEGRGNNVNQCLFVHAIVCMAPERVVYVSCGPATLGRDVKRFSEQGYFPVTALAVDLFPQTSHVESIVCLSREKADDYIRISVQTKDLQTNAN